MLPSGLGLPGRLMAITSLGEMFAPGRTLMAEVLGTEGGRAVLRFAGGEMLDVATRTPLAPGTRVMLQVGTPPEPGAPLELRLVWATSGVDPAAAPEEPPGQAQELPGGATPPPGGAGTPGTFRTATGPGTYRPAPGVPAPAPDLSGGSAPEPAPPAPGLVSGQPVQAPGRLEFAGTAMPVEGTEIVITLADPGADPTAAPVPGEKPPALGSSDPRQAGGLPPRSSSEGAPVPGAAQAVVPGTSQAAATPSTTPAHGASALAAASTVLDAAAGAAPAAPVLTTGAGAGLPAIWLPIPLPGGRQAWVQLVGDQEEEPRRARGAKAAAPAARIYWDSPELGPVSATLDLTGGEEHPRLRTQFALGQAGALKELQQALPDLAAALARVGFSGADLQARLTPVGPAPLPGSAGGRLDRKA